MQVWAFANLNIDPGRDLLDAIAARAQADLHNYSAQNISNLLWAFARLAYLPSKFLAEALAHVLAHLDNFAAQSVVCFITHKLS